MDCHANARNDAFTLAEMMVVLLIMSIVLAAMAPVMTRRMASDSASGSVSPWTWVEGRRNLDAYLKGNNNNQRAMIGQTEVPAANTEDARLILNTSDDIPNHIMFKKGNSILGILRLSGSNIALGNQALTNNTGGSDNIAIGTRALIANTTGSDNIAIGYSALNSNKTGYFNTAIGYLALYRNERNASVDDKSGSFNTAVGDRALYANTTGRNNVAIGGQALWYNTTGSYNVAIGVGTLQEINMEGVYNVAVGNAALAHLGKRGDDHDNYGLTAVGASALGGLQKGFANTAVGQYAMSNLIEGGGNIAIGVSACKGLTKGEYTICIGDNSGPAEGSTEASDKKSRVYISNLLVMEKNGKANFTSAIADVTLNGVSLKNTTSDRRLKNVGKAYTSSLDTIRQLKPYNYTYKKDDKKTPHVGVIAQDLQKIFPNAVQKNDEGYLTIRQEDMFYAVINAIKELDAKITALINKETEKDRKIRELELRIEVLEKKLQ